MKAPSANLAEIRRLLQLETLYDLALALHAQKPEQELIEELLQQLCAVLDPAAAVAVTRDAYGGAQALSSVGWTKGPPASEELLGSSLWRKLLAGGQPVSRREGELAGRSYRELLAVPLASRDIYLGFIAVLDKEVRGRGTGSAFSAEDSRFLDSIAALGGAALESARRRAALETQSQRLAEENKILKERLVEEYSAQRIVAHAPPMRRVLDMVERVAPRNVNILLRGESGTGKELVAKLTHSLSGRSGPLIAINCAAVPEALLESELFGIKGGVATGVQARRGKFELADDGTLFLDEIGDLDLTLQVKLLRALQEREITPVGAQKAIPVDVRVVAATHRDLSALIEDGSFREDLYYRLKVVEVELPPLRERRPDIPHLVHAFVESFCQREKIALPQFSSEALALLLNYDYPGNVRELQNLVEGAVSLADGKVDVHLLRGLLSGGEEDADPLSLEAMERHHIKRVLRITGGNKSAAAKILGLDRRTLQRKGF